MFYGWRDIEALDDVDEIEDQIGSYFAIISRDGILSIQTDYFSMSKVYYYKDEDIFLAANRYQLLLIAMTALNIPKTLNHEKVYAYLAKNNQVMMQNFTRELNIKDTYVLPVDSKVCIDVNSKKVTIEKTSLFYDLSAPLKYTPESYEKLLQEAAEELVDNARVALESSHFENFVVHVTGGLDSRICLCAVSKFPQFNHKIIPFTCLEEYQEKDADVAFKILSKTPFHFHNMPEQKNELEHDVYGEELSFWLGISAEHSGVPMTLMYKNALCLPGFCGAMTGRPYYAALYLGSDLADSFLPDRQFYLHLSQKQGNTVYDADELIAKLLREECSMLPGRTNLEKFENHYIYYRNGIHFNDSWLDHSMSSWSILQSKKMLKLKYMLFPNENIKLQLDILYLLNPEIAAIEFGTDKYNELRKELHAKYGKYPTDTIYDAEKLNMHRASFENMKNTHGNTYESKKQKDFKDIANEENVLKMLNLLVNQNGFDRNIAFQLYCYIKYEVADPRKSFLLRKICSLYYELNC